MYLLAKPVILTHTNQINKLNNINKIILVTQNPPLNYLFNTNYISGDIQTHYAIYKINDDKLELIYELTQIVFDDFSTYRVIQTLTRELQKLKLNHYDINLIRNNIYHYSRLDTNCDS
jgi:hypothetical protein